MVDGSKPRFNHVTTSRKNPENRPLRIKRGANNLLRGVPPGGLGGLKDGVYAVVLSNLAIAQSNLVRAGKDSAMPHFIAIVKELEDIYDFTFEVLEDK